VRGLQVHGAKVKQAVAGQRTAVNLGGVETAELERGMVLAPIGRLRPTQSVDASVQILSDSPRALRSRQRVRVHIGATEALGRVSVLDTTGEIKPGESGFVQVRLEAPVVAVLGDRFIIRSYSPQRTMGGGVILDAFASRHRARELSTTHDRLTELRETTREQKLAALVAGAGERGLSRTDLVAQTAWRDEVVHEVIVSPESGAFVVEVGGQLLSRPTLKHLKENVVAAVAEHHQAEPLSRGLALEVLRGRHFAHASPELFRAVLAELEKEESVVIDKDIVRRPEHSRAVSGADAELRDRLEAVYRDARLAAPSMSDAFTRAGINPSAQQHARKVLQVLIDAGSLVRVDGEMFFHREALDDLKTKVRAYAAKEKSIDVPAFKELAGISRKYAIPLLEYFDRERVTRREGDRRVIL